MDDSQKVRSLGSFLLSTSLSHRASVLAQNHMVQTMFALNGQKYASDLGNEMEKQAIVLTDLQSIQGADSQSRTKRMTIYHHLLKRMSPEHKFAVVAKICQDCLTPLVEGARDLESHFEILRDALIVLASSDMKVSIPSREEAEEEFQLESGHIWHAGGGKLAQGSKARLTMRLMKEGASAWGRRGGPRKNLIVMKSKQKVVQTLLPILPGIID